MTNALLRALKTNRVRFLDRHYDASDWFSKMFSASSYALWRSASVAMRQHCRGLLLDAGAGRGAWRRTALRKASTYESVDIASRGEHKPTWIGDVMDMPSVPSGRFDTVICHQVLEHVRDPRCALVEMRRVLKTGGVLILSVPHLSRRHEIPNDFYRFTQEGVVALLEEAEYDLMEIDVYGGILSFLHHQWSFIFPGLLSGIPLVGTVAIGLNAPLSYLLPFCDRLIDRASLLPLGVTAVARKRT